MNSMWGEACAACLGVSRVIEDPYCNKQLPDMHLLALCACSTSRQQARGVVLCVDMLP